MNLGMENEYLEFKEGLGQLDKGLKSITSMLNKHGQGTVLFGVNDDGDVCGLSVGKNTLMMALVSTSLTSWEVTWGSC